MLEERLSNTFSQGPSRAYNLPLHTQSTSAGLYPNISPEVSSGPNVAESFYTGTAPQIESFAPAQSQYSHYGGRPPMATTTYSHSSSEPQYMQTLPGQSHPAFTPSHSQNVPRESYPVQSSPNSPPLQRRTSSHQYRSSQIPTQYAAPQPTLSSVADDSAASLYYSDPTAGPASLPPDQRSTHSYSNQQYPSAPQAQTDSQPGPTNFPLPTQQQQQQVPDQEWTPQPPAWQHLPQQQQQQPQGQQPVVQPQQQRWAAPQAQQQQQLQRGQAQPQPTFAGYAADSFPTPPQHLPQAKTEEALIEL